MTYDPELTESLVRHAHNILDSIVDFFAQNEVELPERRYISVGQTAHDCEQVTVSFQQLYLGPPGDPAQLPHRCGAPRTSVFVVQVVRALPSGRGGRAGTLAGPTAEALDEVATQQLKDAYLLLAAATDQTLDPWGLGVLADVTPTDPQGAFQAVTMNIISSVP